MKVLGVSENGKDLRDHEERLGLLGDYGRSFYGF